MNNKVIWIVNQYTSTPEVGLGGRSYYLGRELAKKGYTVYVIAASFTHLLKRPKSMSGHFLIENDGLFNFVWVNVFKYTNAHSKSRILNWFLFALKLPFLLRFIPDKPDVIVNSSPSLISYLGAKYIAKKTGAKLIFEVRDIWPLTLVKLGGYSTQHLFIRYLQWIENKAYRESDHVISNLKNAVDHMRIHGMDPNKFVWIPNGFYREEVENAAPLSTDSLNSLPLNSFMIGYTGSLGVANALDNLINAAILLSKEYSDISFVIVGDGKEKKALNQLMYDNHLNNVYFIDSINKQQIQSMLAHFDVCYIGLKKDPLFRFGVSPNKLFDYMYASKPIIYAIDSGDYNPINEANAGIQVMAEDPESLADSIRYLYHMQKSERKLIGANGKKYVIENHTYEALADKFIINICE